MSETIKSKLAELLQFAKKHGLEEMAWKDGDLKIAFRRNMTGVAASSAAVDDAPAEAEEKKEALEFVRSPMVGTFRRSTNKGRPPLMMVGNHVKPGDAMAVVECMKIPTEVVSYCGGEIREILVEDGQPVEYGQPLFSVGPANGSAN